MTKSAEPGCSVKIADLRSGLKNNKKLQSQSRNKNYRLSVNQQNVNISQLEEWFDKFTIIESHEFEGEANEEEPHNGHEQVAKKENSKSLDLRSLKTTRPANKSDASNKQNQQLTLRSPSLSRQIRPSRLPVSYTIPGSVLKITLTRTQRISVPPPVEDILPINDLAILTRQPHMANATFVIKKSLTISDYKKLSVNLKFKICLNFIRFNIFKKFRQNTKDGLSQATYNDISNIKNIFFYQIFKRFEQYYKVDNKLINYLEISTENKIKVIEVVEKVYLNSWNLTDYVKLEEHLLNDIY